MIWETNQEISAINERNESETDTVVDLPFCVTEPAKDSIAKQPFVLIVSSAADYRVRLEKTLQRMGCRVVGVQCASTALSLLEQQRFDVCLLDNLSSRVQVIDMIQRIRNSLTAGGPYIMVLTDPTAKFAAAEAIENGADDFIEKPVDERLLQARIRSSLRQNDARLSELSKFLPANILDQVLLHKNLMAKPRPADVSVMVCDVRGFSRVSERLGPVQTITWISDVMNELSRTILDHGGTIVDYVGDEIMAMWGAPVGSPEHPNEACDCAIAIQKAVSVLSEKWRTIVGSETRLGIGINSGLAVVGNTGSSHRMKYGPLGDTVNLASRVQGATKYLRSSILITQSTASRLDPRLLGRRVCSVRVHNIREAVQLFELTTCNSKSDDVNCRAYEKALAAFESEQHSVAQEILAQLLIDSPKDGPAMLLMLRVIQSQLGGVFDPVWTLPGG